MSLATYASPYNESTINNNAIEEKRRYRNRTLKKKEKPSNPKVDAMMKQIYDEDRDEETEAMSDFQPLGPPESASMINNDRGLNNQPRANYDYETLIKEQTEETNIQNYQQDYNQQDYNQQTNNQQDWSNNNMFPSSYQGANMYNKGTMDQDELMRKMNYIIYMLEEQKNEKTDNIMEELILYTFLGVFVIFVVDSFARVGKYKR
jgi:hypothetical protein